VLPASIAPAIPASEGPQTYALDGVATGIGTTATTTIIIIIIILTYLLHGAESLTR
jgi:hypothetical protein